MKNATFMVVAIYFKFFSDSFINLSIQDGSSPWYEFQYLNIILLEKKMTHMKT